VALPTILGSLRHQALPLGDPEGGHVSLAVKRHHLGARMVTVVAHHKLLLQHLSPHRNV
jgi:hypothetical protein